LRPTARYRGPPRGPSDESPRGLRSPSHTERQRLGGLREPHVYFSLPAKRTTLLKALSSKLPPQINDVLSRVIQPRSSDDEEQHLSALLDALQARQAVRLKY
jgi:hypothetical protein